MTSRPRGRERKSLYDVKWDGTGPVLHKDNFVRDSSGLDGLRLGEFWPHDRFPIVSHQGDKNKKRTKDPVSLVYLQGDLSFDKSEFPFVETTDSNTLSTSSLLGYRSLIQVDWVQNKEGWGSIGRKSPNRPDNYDMKNLFFLTELSTRRHDSSGNERSGSIL